MSGAGDNSDVSAAGLLTSAESAMIKLKPTIRSLIKSIDSGIVLTNTAGKDTFTYDLPTTFDIPRLPRADAQIMVYSELIKVYTSPQRGFAVKIIPGVRPKIVLAWKHGITDAEKDARIELINAHTSR